MFNVRVLKKIIELYHITEIAVCYDGRQAVEKVKEAIRDPIQRVFDVVFMDIEMPEMNGFEACKAIK